MDFAEVKYLPYIGHTVSPTKINLGANRFNRKEVKGEILIGEVTRHD